MDKYRLVNSGDTTKIYILTDIGGWEGIQSAELIPEIHKIKSSRIDLHINSMGGDVFQATAIFNALAEHPAYKRGIVDGVAASAASYLIQVCDEIEMGAGTQMMIHDAAGGFQGNYSDGQSFLKLLDSVSNEIAAFYAKRAGGTVQDWRKKMKAETWYTAEEAVNAGLADKVVGTNMSPANRIEMQLALVNRADLKYKGRENAPEPVSVDNNEKKVSEPILNMDALLNTLRDALKEAN